MKTRIAANRVELKFDMFRLTKAKALVDICSITIREYNRQGLPFYRRGRAVFLSRTELDAFIRNPRPFALGDERGQGGVNA